MTGGEYRHIPATINDIFPDGQALDQVAQLQIDVVLTRPYLKPIPEPGTLSLYAIALAALFARRRKKA